MESKVQIHYQVIYVSILTASIGHTAYQPVNGTYELLTAIEAIIGTFLWAIAIVIFGKKFIMWNLSANYMIYTL